MGATAKRLPKLDHVKIERLENKSNSIVLLAEIDSVTEFQLEKQRERQR